MLAASVAASVQETSTSSPVGVRPNAEGRERTRAAGPGLTGPVSRRGWRGRRPGRTRRGGRGGAGGGGPRRALGGGGGGNGAPPPPRPGGGGRRRNGPPPPPRRGRCGGRTRSSRSGRSLVRRGGSRSRGRTRHRW